MALRGRCWAVQLVTGDNFDFSPSVCEPVAEWVRLSVIWAFSAQDSLSAWAIWNRISSWCRPCRSKWEAFFSFGTLCHCRNFQTCFMLSHTGLMILQKCSRYCLRYNRYNATGVPPTRKPPSSPPQWTLTRCPELPLVLFLRTFIVGASFYCFYHVSCRDKPSFSCFGDLYYAGSSAGFWSLQRWWRAGFFILMKFSSLAQCVSGSMALSIF